jgi:hypothetical protein
MKSNQRLRLQQKFTQQKMSNLFTTICHALTVYDSESRPATLEESLVSKHNIKILWDALPNEWLSYTYEAPEDHCAKGFWCLNGLGNPIVTLHLGYETLCFVTTLKAAWAVWHLFDRLDNVHEGGNACIYPSNFDWYLIRAGSSLYPMECSRTQQPELMKPV